MGSSNTITADLPDASSPSLILTHPTGAEKLQTWSLTHGEWGGLLTKQQYLEREAYLATIPLARDGGITHWLLTTADGGSHDAGAEKSPRPVLATCETILKRALVAIPNARSETAAADGDLEIKEVFGHGIGSVFTYPEYRGHSYASRMLRDVGQRLHTWERFSPTPGTEGGGTENTATFSALWSDIGKKFYGNLGWPAFASKQVDFPASYGLDKDNTGSVSSTGLKMTPITYSNLGEYCALDETSMRRRVAKTARETGKTALALAPSHDQLLWHLYRDSYIASFAFPDRDPSNGVNGNESASRQHPGPAEAHEIKGVAIGPVGRRVWAIWTRNYAGPDPENVEKNKMYILRLVIENEDESKASLDNLSPELVDAFTSVIRVAQDEATKWKCGSISLWNPDELVTKLVEKSGLKHGVLEREKDSIPSLMWYGEGNVDDVVWVSNDKYCWF